MTRVLIRAGKDPMTPSDPFDTLDRDLIGRNSGNLIFAAAAHKLLSASDVNVVANGYSFDPRTADRVNDEYDYVVLPFANAFRASYEPQLKQISAFIEKLDIPVIMLSGGAQSTTDGSFSNLKKIEPTVKRFVGSVLDRSTNITVRGEQTADYIRSLGFRDVDVIGCPSMTMNGRNHRVENPESKDNYKIAYNVQTSKDIIGGLVEEIERDFDATYVPQDLATLEMMLWGKDEYPQERDPRLPLRMNHEQFQRNRARFMVDAYTWIDFMGGVDLSIGPRIHGNIAAILAGKPAVVISHDSRTEELADYHRIPRFTPQELDGNWGVADAIERMDFQEFNAGQPQRFDKVIGFLHKNGLRTIFDPGEEHTLESYEANIQSSKCPDPVEVSWHDLSNSALDRLRSDRRTFLAQAEQLAALKREVRDLRKTLKAVGNTLR